MPPLRPGRGPRYLILVADQALYAASNLAAVALAGRLTDGAGFGRFMLGFLALSVTVNASRAWWSEPELAAGVVTLHPSRRGALVAAALAAGLILVAHPLTIGVGAAIAVVLQDRLRFGALSRGDVTASLRSDGLWLGLLVAVGLVALTRRAAPVGVADVVRWWALGGLAASLVSLPPRADRFGPARSAPPRRRPPSPVAPGRTLFLGDFVLQSGATQLVGLALGAVLAREPYGELRAAITLLGPIGVANTALTTQLLTGRRAGRPLVAGIVAAALVVVGGLLLVPPRLGVAVVGAAWPGRATVGLIGLTVAAQTLTTRGLTGLKLRAQRRPLLVIRAGGAATLAATTVVLAARWQRADVVAAGYLAVNAAMALASIHAARSAARRPVTGRAATPPGFHRYPPDPSRLADL